MAKYIILLVIFLHVGMKFSDGPFTKWAPNMLTIFLTISCFISVSRYSESCDVSSAADISDTVDALFGVDFLLF